MEWKRKTKRQRSMIELAINGSHDIGIGGGERERERERVAAGRIGEWKCGGMRCIIMKSRY